MSIRQMYISLLLFVCVVPVALAEKGELKSLEQRFSYTLGYTFGTQMKGQIVAIDKDALIEAIDDVFSSKKPRLSKEDMTNALNEVNAKIAKLSQEKAQKTLEDGKKYLAENKKREGVVVLPNGIQYLVLKKGEGDSPKQDSDVTVNYVGTRISGAVFDSSKRHGGPATFNLGRVIPGFRDAISKMKKGSKWQVFIPSELAYGQAGSPPSIFPNETLVFEIDLVSFKNKETSPKDAKPSANGEKPSAKNAK
jgi:FKBP-type peptidyl-prolyl cis-trans isomerase FklB